MTLCIIHILQSDMERFIVYHKLCHLDFDTMKIVLEVAARIFIDAFNFFLKSYPLFFNLLITDLSS